MKSLYNVVRCTISTVVIITVGLFPNWRQVYFIIGTFIHNASSWSPPTTMSILAHYKLMGVVLYCFSQSGQSVSSNYDSTEWWRNVPRNNTQWEIARKRTDNDVNDIFIRCPRIGHNETSVMVMASIWETTLLVTKTCNMIHAYECHMFMILHQNII